VLSDFFGHNLLKQFAGEKMNNKFTEKAEKALNSAIGIAESYGHTYVGSEHVLLALSDDSLSCSYAVLNKNGITKEKIDTAIRELSGSGGKSNLTPKDMTPRCRKILENSYKNSLKFSSTRIGTEHILLAVLEEKESVAVKIISYLAADAVSIRDEIITFLRSKKKKTASPLRALMKCSQTRTTSLTSATKRPARRSGSPLP
jgi:ATP-dependent Clp protease ATP-binding subunit ClpC